MIDLKSLAPPLDNPELLNMHVCVDYFNVMRSNICCSSELVLIHEYANKVQLNTFSKNHDVVFYFTV